MDPVSLAHSVALNIERAKNTCDVELAWDTMQDVAGLPDQEVR